MSQLPSGGGGGGGGRFLHMFSLCLDFSEGVAGDGAVRQVAGGRLDSR